MVEAAADSVKNISSHNTIGILNASFSPSLLRTRKNLQAVAGNTNAAVLSMQEEGPAYALSAPRFRRMGNRSGPDPPPRPCNLLKIHELREGIHFHSYSNIRRLQEASFVVEPDAPQLRTRSGNNRLSYCIALMP